MSLIWINRPGPASGKIECAKMFILDMERNISSITTLVREAARAPRLMSQPVTDIDTELLREEYLENIIRPDWDQKFYRLLTDMRPPSLAVPSIRITVNQQTRDVNLPCYIGRLVPPKYGAAMDHIYIENGSRCHVMITQINDELIIIDPGSLVGICTLKRNSGAPLEHSLPKARKVLKFANNERFVLDLKSAFVGFNLDVGETTECIVCMTLPAVERLRCGHCVACTDCLNQLSTCPVCRNPSIGLRQFTVDPQLMYRPPVAHI
jgi:hypothetical protein